jgi:hypothetical protein
MPWISDRSFHLNLAWQPLAPGDAVMELFAELDRLGEGEVRRLLKAEAFAPDQMLLVREWLLRRAEDWARWRAERDAGR